MGTPSQTTTSLTCRSERFTNSPIISSSLKAGIQASMCNERFMLNRLKCLLTYDCEIRG